MTGPPVAWRVIERGWRVFDADGNEVGKVDAVTGDIDEDIFNGIAFGDGGTVLTRSRYVPAEHVTAIREGEIVLDLRAEDVAALERYTPPVSEPLTALLPDEGRASAQEQEKRGPLDWLFPWRR
jgi:sporulation protein YlmC with PRC-barrel domain